MIIDVIPTAGSISEYDIRGRTAVVFDVLRATSTIVTALFNGCAGVVPVATLEEAMRLGSAGALLAAERGGERVDGFPHGNSPLEYHPQVVENKDLVLTTSNGTRAIRGTADGLPRRLYIGSLLNAGAVAGKVGAGRDDVVMVCAGTAGGFALEDTLGAGMVILELVEAGLDIQLSDLATMACRLAMFYREDPLQGLYDSNHGKKLLNMGLEADLRWCAKLNAIDMAPHYSGDRVVV